MDGIKKVSLIVERENGETMTFDGKGIIGSLITSEDGDNVTAMTAIAGSFSKSTLLYAVANSMEGVVLQLAQHKTPLPVLHDVLHGMVEVVLENVVKKAGKAASPEQKALLALALLLGKLRE